MSAHPSFAVQSPAERFREASHAWYTREPWPVDADGPQPLRGKAVFMPQRMFAEDLTKRFGMSLRHWSRTLELIEERTKHLADGIVLHAGDGAKRVRRYIDRNSLYRLQALHNYGLLLDAHAEEITHDDGRRGPKGAETASQIQQLKAEQRGDRGVRVDKTLAMAALLGETERDMQRGERYGAGPLASSEETFAREWEAMLFEDVRDVAEKNGALDSDDGSSAEERAAAQGHFYRRMLRSRA